MGALSSRATEKGDGVSQNSLLYLAPLFIEQITYGDYKMSGTVLAHGLKSMYPVRLDIVWDSEKAYIKAPTLRSLWSQWGEWMSV